MSQIGKVKLRTEAGNVDLRVYENGDSGSEVLEAWQIQTSSGKGFIPLAEPNEATEPYLRVMTDQGVKAVHKDPNVQFLTNRHFDDGGTGWEKFNNANVTYESSTAYTAYNGDASAGVKQEFYAPKGTYTVTVRGRTTNSNQQCKTAIREVTGTGSLDNRIDIFSTSFKTKSETFNVSQAGTFSLRTGANWTADAEVDYVKIE